MGKFIRLLVFAAFVSVAVSFADATSPNVDTSVQYDYSDSSSEEDDCQQIKCKKPNEIYDVCPASCPPRVCGVDERLILCAPQPKPGDPNCNKPACRCKNGFYRDDKGNCVRWEQCPQCSKRNEVYDKCYLPCLQATCEYTPRPELVKCACVAGCRCIDGYVRNKDGDCIQKEECVKCSKQNEIYDACFSPCLQRTCDYDTRLVKCAPPPKPGDPGCVAGCRCIDGYIRNRAGACVRREQCDTCRGDDNAKPGCGVNCGKKCSDIGKKKPGPCPEICQLDGCDCKPGFYYDENIDRCVRPKDCSPTCRANEVYSSCANGGCGKRKCTDLGKPDLCIDPRVCKPGCVCATGYYRDANGRCVTEKECIDQTQCSKRNEVYDQCYLPCLQATCEYTPRPELVKCACVAGCRCIDGYVRNKDGDCIRKEECVKCLKQNEIYDACFSPCLQRTCDYDTRLVKCAPPPKPGDPGCVAGCRCIDGYIRNRAGACVRREQCDTCRGDDNAKPGCGVNCGKKCSDIGKKKPGPCPEICQLDGCDCKPGFYYDENIDRCVRPKDCSPTCRANEVYSSCANGGCGKRKCTDLGKPDLCIDPRVCKPGCVCATGYYRDANGRCVTEKECIDQIGCGGDINAVAGCGNCGRRCRDYGLPGPFICPRIACRIGSCKCKDGFYYNEKLKKCVRPGQCNQCKENEELSLCANGICRAQDCKEKGTIPLCPPMIPDSCKAGCVCKINFLRKSGVCIPEQDCDARIPITPTNTTSCDNASDIVVRLRQGNYILNGKFLYQLMKLNPKQSVVGSAFSLTTPLAQCLLNAKDDPDTFSELLKALNVNSADEVRCAFRQFLDSVKAANGTVLDLAVKAYVKDTYQFSETFKKDNREIFNAEEESINFSNAVNAANTINQWVSGATKGKITDLVKPDMFDSLTRFVLANAIYFKGAWKIAFDPRDTKKADFYVDGQNTKQVDMMEMKARMNYNVHADLDAQTVELPFQDENISFVVILPNQNDGILDLVDKLQNGDALDRAVSSFVKENVALNMPRLDISTSTDLIQALSPIGVKSLFTQGSRLRGMIVPDESLYVGIAVQKATITLDENGAEAAAANAFIGTRSLPKSFVADHPYAYCIKVGKVVIFCGVNYG